MKPVDDQIIPLWRKPGEKFLRELQEHPFVAVTIHENKAYVFTKGLSTHMALRTMKDIVDAHKETHG